MKPEHRQLVKGERYTNFGRLCEVETKEMDNHGGLIETKFIGRFHTWGVMSDKHSKTNDTCGVIEKADGKMFRAKPTKIKFIEPMNIEEVSK